METFIQLLLGDASLDLFSWLKNLNLSLQTFGPLLSRSKAPSGILEMWCLQNLPSPQREGNFPGFLAGAPADAAHNGPGPWASLLQRPHLHLFPKESARLGLGESCHRARPVLSVSELSRGSLISRKLFQMSSGWLRCRWCIPVSQ